MFKHKLGENSPIPKFLHLKIRRRDGVESLTTLNEGEFKVSIDGYINGLIDGIKTIYKSTPTYTKRTEDCKIYQNNHFTQMQSCSW